MTEYAAISTPLDNMEDEIDLSQYLRLLRKWAWLIVACTLLASISAFVVSSLMAPVYQAKTTLLISAPPSNKQSDYNDFLLSERLAKTYAEMVTKRPVLAEVVNTLQLPDTPDELAKRVKVQQTSNTLLIEVSVEDTSPGMAATIANTLVEKFIAQVQVLQSQRYAESKKSLNAQIEQLQADMAQIQEQLQSLGPNDPQRAQLETILAQNHQTYNALLQNLEDLKISEAQSSTSIYQVEPATPPERPVRPRKLLNTVLAGVVGAMLAIGAIFLIQALDKSIHTPEEVQSLYGLPVLGLIPDLHPGNKNGQGPVKIEPRSPAAEALRSLRANLEFVSPDHPLQAILVTSPEPGEGKSFITYGIAQILAQAGRKTIMVDCDLRKPTLHTKVEMRNRQGLSDVFRGKALTQVIQSVNDNLDIITSGPLPPNPSELLSSEKMSNIIAELKNRYDMVVIDAPPGFISDTAFLARQVDGVTVVMQPGVTNRQLGLQLMEQLRRANARLVGVIFNRVTHQNGYGYYYYDKYNRYYHIEEKTN